MKSSSWVHYFKLKILKVGDRIVVLSHNQNDLFAIMFACGILGPIFVPFNWRLSELEWIHLLKDCQPRLVFTDETL